MLALPQALLALATSALALLQPPPFAPLAGPVDGVLIQKADRELFLVRDGWPVRMYPVALGFAPEGPKTRQGDGRTPEGDFRVDRRNAASAFHLSLGIDYPRPQDVAAARAAGVSPGGDIFIHGQPPGTPRDAWHASDWTRGCVAIADAHMDVLWDHVPIGTPVRIVP